MYNSEAEFQSGPDTPSIITVHNELRGRETANSHPATAISLASGTVGGNDVQAGIEWVYSFSQSLETDIDNKVDKVVGKGLSTEDYTTTEKSKLAGIESGAQVNPNATEIKISYESNADTNAFTDLEKTKLAGIEDGAEVNPTNSEIKTSYELNPDTNAFTDAEKTKLSGIEANAQVNKFDFADAPSDGNTYARKDGVWSLITVTGVTADDVTETATRIWFTPAERTKLDNIEAGAQVNKFDFGDAPSDNQEYVRKNGLWVLNSGTGGGGGGDMLAATYDPTGVIGDAFDMDNMAEGTTNKIFTDVERTKLTGIEDGAQVNVGTNISINTTATTATINSSTGTGAPLSLATATLAGLLSPSEKGLIDSALQGVTAGTGITIDNTDPNNPVITSTATGIDYTAISTPTAMSVGENYLATTTDTHTLPSTGLSVGDTIRFTWGEGVTSTVTSAANISVTKDTTVTDTTWVFTTYIQELVFFWNGAGWEIK